MHRIVLALALALVFVARPASASQDTGVMATVHQFMDGLNKNDTKAALAACDSYSIIIDDFPPHAWHGPAGCADWLNGYNADAQRQGITDGIVALGKPWHVDITADRAYVVVPANYTYKQHGKTVIESGSILTVALRKVAAGWRITGWSWARH